MMATASGIMAVSVDEREIIYAACVLTQTTHAHTVDSYDGRTESPVNCAIIAEPPFYTGDGHAPVVDSDRAG